MEATAGRKSYRPNTPKIVSPRDPNVSLKSKYSVIDQMAEAYKKVTREEELEWILKAQAGDRGAEDFLIRNNIRIVLVQVRRLFKGNPNSIDDVVQEGILGLLTGIRKFDPESGHRLITYAVHWVVHKIMRFMDEDHMVALPSYKSRQVSAFARYGVEVDHRIKNQVLPMLSIASLDAPLPDNKSGVSDGDYLQMVESPWSNFEDRLVGQIEADRLVKVAKEAVLKNRGPRDWRIVEAVYGLGGTDPMNLRQTGDAFDVSHERVRQILRDVDKMLRPILEAKS